MGDKKEEEAKFCGRICGGDGQTQKSTDRKQRKNH
jgi:hypothetical protein